MTKTSDEQQTMLVVRLGRRIRNEISRTHQGAMAQSMDKKDFLLGKAKKYKVAVEVRDAKPIVKGNAITTLDQLIKMLTEQQAAYKSTALGVLELKQWEVTMKTSSGSRLLAATDMGYLHYQETERRKIEAAELKKKYEEIPGNNNVVVRIEDLNLELTRFFLLTMDYANRFGQRADALMQLALEFISHEAVKAWVVANPDTRHEFLVASLKVFDQGINATDRAGGAVGYVPDPHAQAASTGVKWAMVAAKAGKAVVDKLALSADVDRQIDKELEDQGLGAMLEKHNTESDLIARMLADKTKRELALILKLARPIVSVAVEWVPYAPVEKIWDAVEKVITSAVGKYQDERLALAKGEGHQGIEVFKSFHKGMLDNLKDTLEHDILAITDLVNLLADAALATLIDDLMTMVMGVLPIDPAQLINGAELRGMMNSIIAASQVRVGMTVESPTDAAVRPRPKVDSEGLSITCLSGPINEADNGGYRYVRRASGAIGRLYLADSRFEAASASDSEAAVYFKAPTKDGHGRPLSEINLTHRMPLDTLPGKFGYRARSGDVTGEIDEGFDRFHSTGPDPERLDEAAWRMRSIDPKAGGYWNMVDGKRTGEIVSGTWHRPWKARTSTYVFRTPDGARSFALGLWRTGEPGISVSDAVDKIAENGYPVRL